mmetsp:Transcript_90030/g.275606  ORF Transcript_90030/g.275606 Transcript_90030/m.275606 type:complete len:775 (+) Transcript_90030:3951-6275(+)
MADGVVEQHKIHGRELLVVLRELGLHDTAQRRHVLDREVLALVATGLGHEGRLDEGLREHLVLGDAAEVLRTDLLQYSFQLLLIVHADEAIGEHPVALVQPHPRVLRRAVLVQRRHGVEQALEDVTNVLQVELVMELRRRRQEAWRVQDAIHKRVDCGLDDRPAQLLHAPRECAQVLLQDRGVNALDGLRAGGEARDDGEAPLQPRVDHERPSLGVHASGEIYVDEVELVLERLPVVHLGVRHHLREQHDGGLGVVRVDVRHVQVVDEEHALLVARRPEGPAGPLVERAHDDALQRGRVRVIVVVDVLADKLLVLRLQLCEEVLHDRCFARASNANIKYRLLAHRVQVQHILHTFELHAADHDVLEHALGDGGVRVDVVLPADPVLGVGLEAVVVAIAGVREAHRLGQALHEYAERLPVIHRLVVRDGPADGPHHSEREHRVVGHLQVVVVHGTHGLVVLLRVVVHQRVDVARERVHEAHVEDRAREVELLADRLNVGLEVVRKVQVERALRQWVHLLAPTLHVRLPTDVGLVDEEHAAARNRRRAGVLHVLDLKDHTHRGRKRDALVAHQSQHLIVIHDRVHRLDPRGVDVAVEDDPLVDVRRLVAVHLLAHVAEDDGDEPVLPFLCLRHDAVQLVGRHGLGIRLLPGPVLPDLFPRVQQGLPHLRLPAARGADDEHAVPHPQNPKHADDFDDELGVRLQSAFPCGRRNNLLELGVGERVGPHAREQVLDQPEEDRHVQGRDLRRVEVPERAAQHGVLVALRLHPLQRARLPE